MGTRRKTTIAFNHFVDRSMPCTSSRITVASICRGRSHILTIVERIKRERPSHPKLILDHEISRAARRLKRNDRMRRSNLIEIIYFLRQSVLASQELPILFSLMPPEQEDSL
jgi:hypothetical protein